MDENHPELPANEGSYDPQDRSTGLTLRNTILLLIVVPAAIAILVFTILFILLRSTDMEDRLQDKGRQTTHMLATAARFETSHGNTEYLLNLLNSTLETSDVRSAAFYDENRRRLVSAGESPVEPRSLPASLADEPSLLIVGDIMRYALPLYPLRGGPFSRRTFDQDAARIRAPNARAGTQTEPLPEFAPVGTRDLSSVQQPAWVVVEISRTATQLARYRTGMIAGLSSLGFLALIYLIANILSQRLARSLGRLRNQVGRISEGKPPLPADTDDGPEFYMLSRGIEDLGHRLILLQNEMQNNVDQATSDLRETLETIEVQNIQLDIARKDALEASRVKSEFLANMSHEIRTPLNGIIGFARLLTNSELSRHQRDQLNTILKSSEILLTIINDILDFSKIEAGKLVLDYARVDLNEVIEDVITMLAPVAHEKNLDLAAMIYSDTPPCFYGDLLRLKQVITNLVNNAIKFTSHGDIVLRAMHDGLNDRKRPVLRITVTDTGPGLSRLQQQQLFTPFTQADTSAARRHTGTGLGLVISRRLVEQMEGKIGVESELGHGASFWFTLPIEAAVQPDGEAFIPPRSLKGERLLYLEQQPKTGLALEALLRSWGADVDRCESYAELIPVCEAAQKSGRGYGVVLIGFGPRFLHALPLTQAIRQLEHRLDCRTLVLLPTGDLGYKPHNLLTEASAALNKPPIRRRLAEVLDALVNGEAVLPLNSAEPSYRSGSDSVPRVLAVDDNEANLKLILALLGELGALGTGALSGYEALRVLREEKFDLVFMDVQMPGMDGIETTRKIRESELAGQHLPVIALTAHAMPEERVMLISQGFDDYLTKPVDVMQLEQTIERHTGHKVKLEAPRPERPASERRSDVMSLGGEQARRIRPSARSEPSDCVDIAAAVRLAGFKASLAEELFSMLLESLPAATTELADLLRRREPALLLEEVHKLHGATRYCGVPALRDAAERTETALKQGMEPYEPLVHAVLQEIERIEYWADRHDWQELFRGHQSEAERAGISE